MENRSIVSETANASCTNASCANASCANASCANASCANASCANASCANASCANASCANASCAKASCAKHHASARVTTYMASRFHLFPAATTNISTSKRPALLPLFLHLLSHACLHPLPCCSAASLPLAPPPCAPLPPLSLPPSPLPEQVRKQQGSSARRLTAREEVGAALWEQRQGS
ncbi:unnamed protein product [Closterium sp. Naga37s-1]|nr:unnamed protein product [Closterium sp. Naga37s-1]